MSMKEITAPTGTKDVSDKKKAHNKKLSWELLRFLITGIICTVIDFGVSYGLMFVFANNLSLIEGYGNYLAFGIAATAGFVISCIVNYVLSRFFVFKNVSKDADTKSAKAFWIYFFLALGGWVIGLGLQELGVWICQLCWNMNLSLDITQVSWVDLWNEGGLAFWAFVVIFVIKTCVTLVYNYITRKTIIFKKPKEGEEEVIAPIEKEEEKETTYVAPEEKLVTAESLRQIVHEELLSYYGKGQLIIDEKEAREVVESELDKYWKTNPSRH